MSEGIECPICFCTFTSSKINSHVEICLSRDERRTTRRGNEASPGEGSYADSVSGSSYKLMSEYEADDDLGVAQKSVNVTEEKDSSVTACSPNQSDQLLLESRYGKIIGKKELSSKSAPRSITNVLGKRKCPDQSSPNATRMRLATHPKFNPSNTNLHMLFPSSKTEREATPITEKVKAADIIDKSINGQSLVDPSGKTAIPYPRKTTLQYTDLTKKSLPLAEQMRPKEFDRYFGQDEVIGQDSSLRTLLSAGKVPSMILWGPPGCGKTSLVNIIATMCKNNPSKRFVKLSATTSGINDVKEVVKLAKNEAAMLKRETVLFIDEIHRFNKLQQDFFLPHVEYGTITLIGATTENPSFQVNNALLSRCKVLVLKKHTVQSLMNILEYAVHEIEGNIIDSPEESEVVQTGPCFLRGALEALANLSDGDARTALNGLEMAANCFRTNASETAIDAKQIASVFQRNHVLYDRNGEEHYNIISAFHKSIRGSDDSAALYWLARMLGGGEDPLYIARRMIRAASEDIGMYNRMGIVGCLSLRFYRNLHSSLSCKTHLLGYPSAMWKVFFIMEFLFPSDYLNLMYKILECHKNMNSNLGLVNAFCDCIMREIILKNYYFDMVEVEVKIIRNN